MFLHVRCIPHHNSIKKVWASVCLCVCVNHLNRCKTSTMFLQGGSESHSIHCPTKTVVWDCDIGTDHPDVPAIFQFIVNGYRLSQVPACRSKPFQLLHCCRNLVLFYFILSSIASEPSSEQGRRKHTSNWIARWINQFLLSDFTGLFVHVRCIPHQ